jgi:glycerophosphoryl diester phosphodiesterase
MLKIGHRGAKGYVAENTLASFKKALHLEVDGIELDVHLSSDGEIMVIHDETIDRTTAAKGFVKDCTALELNKLGIPTLENVLELINQKCLVNIEIKDKIATEKVVSLIEKYVLKNNWNYHQFQISSFIWESLERISKLNSSILLGVLTENEVENALAFANKINAHSINPYFKLLNSENVIAIHRNGFKIFTWTVNSEEDLTFVKSLNVDGIISDFPDRI